MLDALEAPLISEKKFQNFQEFFSNFRTKTIKILRFQCKNLIDSYLPA